MLIIIGRGAVAQDHVTLPEGSKGCSIVRIYSRVASLHGNTVNVQWEGSILLKPYRIAATSTENIV